MNAFTRLGKPRTRGGRISQRGYHLSWIGFAGIFVGGWTVGELNAPGPVMLAVVVAAFATAFAGLGIAVYGRRKIDRDLAEYNRQVESGERPPWKPGDPNPLG